MVTALKAIYEADFLGFSYGFHPGRSQHQALDALWVGFRWKKVNWVLDADIQSFFDDASYCPSLCGLIEEVWLSADHFEAQALFAVCS